MTAPDSQPPYAGAPPSPRTPAGPDHHELYVLAAGILLGVLLGPAVLGRLAPSTYDRLFVGSGEQERQVDARDQGRQAEADQFNRETRDQMDRLRASGASDAARQEYALARLRLEAKARNRYQQERLTLDGQVELARQQRRQWLTGHLLALILATAVLMVGETLVDRRRRPVLCGRLASLRYALLALWLALILAQPILFRPLPGLFTLVLIVVVLALALLPIPGLLRRGG